MNACRQPAEQQGAHSCAAGGHARRSAGAGAPPCAREAARPLAPRNPGELEVQARPKKLQVQRASGNSGRSCACPGAEPGPSLVAGQRTAARISAPALESHAPALRMASASVRRRCAWPPHARRRPSPYTSTKFARRASNHHAARRASAGAPQNKTMDPNSSKWRALRPAACKHATPAQWHRAPAAAAAALRTRRCRGHAGRG